jgi:hypothetical protein
MKRQSKRRLADLEITDGDADVNTIALACRPE